ncbi:DNA-binding protein [Pseudomonas oryzihabitans]|nr:DNA-binding protein [Pseudomonas psychrotolerans]
MSRLPRLVLFRLLPAFILLVLLVLLVLTFVWHWNDRALLWWQESRTPPAVRAQSVWLPDYRAVIQGKQLPGLAEAETSDLTYDPRTRTLFAVTGTTPYLVQLSLTGDVLRRIPIQHASNLEGVTALEDGRLAIVDERQRRLSLFTLADDTRELDANTFEHHDLGFPDAGNKGFEGIAWDPRHQRLILSKERDPAALFTLASDGRGVSGTLEPFPIKQQVIDYSAVAVDPRTGHLLALSDQSHTLMEYTAEGQPVSFMSLRRGLHGLDATLEQPEGVALDDAGTLYVIGEPNIFHVFRKVSAPAQ